MKSFYERPIFALRHTRCDTLSTFEPVARVPLADDRVLRSIAYQDDSAKNMTPGFFPYACKHAPSDGTLRAETRALTSAGMQCLRVLPVLTSLCQKEYVCMFHTIRHRSVSHGQPRDLSSRALRLLCA